MISRKIGSCWRQSPEAACRAMSTFNALVTKAKKTPASVETMDVSQLPKASSVKASPGPCETIVKVDYSTLNYKDAMVVLGTYPGLKYPMVGGIDLAGTVSETRDDSGLRKGQQVLINGFGMGTDHFGGYAELASVPSAWCMPLEEMGGIGTIDAARIGTAGYTAMLMVDRLMEVGKLTPTGGPVLITGATGGVGSVAVTLLASLGFDIVAVTGKVEEQNTTYLRNLGAKTVISRSDFESPEPKALAKETYAACVDTVGGRILANVLPLMKQHGCVTCCGNAAGMNLSTNVAPFILRGVSMLGVDSVYQPAQLRKKVYQKYVPALREGSGLERIGREQVIGLSQVTKAASDMMSGKVSGRIVVDVSKP